MDNVHVFIVNYKSADLLADCLHSLQSQPIACVHVIDNYSSALERERVQLLCASFPNVAVTLTDTNLGFGPALNNAIQDANLAPHDIVWMLNPDTRVGEGAVVALVEYLHSGYDIVSPSILTGDMTDPRIWFAGGVLDKRKVKSVHIGLGEPWESASRYLTQENTFITGAAMMMLSSTWKDLGGFREGFFLYWEDADISERAVAKGLRLGVSNSASVWHAVGGSGSTSGMSAVYYYHMQRNRLWLSRKWSSRRNILLGTGFRETLALTLRPLKEKEGRVSKTRSSIRGLVHGVLHTPL